MKSCAVVPQLVTKGILTPEDVERILLRQSSREQAMLLLSVVKKNGVDGYSYMELFSILKNDEEHRPHHQLGKDLEEICQRKFMQQCMLTCDDK
jgi:hypothetical protein